MCARVASVATVCGLSQVCQDPIQVRRKSFRASHRNGLVDVLALPAVALRRHHHPPRDLVGHLAAQLAAHQMQAGVDARRGPRAGDQVAVVDEQHVAVDLGRRIHPGQFVGVHPVCGARPAVEQPRGACDERARAHRQDDRTGIGGLSDRIEGLRQVAPVLTADRGDRHQVNADQVVQPVIRRDCGAHRRPQRLARLRSADLEIEVGNTVGGAVDAEDLADHAELKNR